MSLSCGLSQPDLPQIPPVAVSAYADDVPVFIQDQRGIRELDPGSWVHERKVLQIRSAGKCEACWVGQCSLVNTPGLPRNLRWKYGGIKVLGMYLGRDNL